ncbi:MAG TPA: HIT family protein [Candidatus Saccharimonadales bacterium]|nr:HIT family protein [Candidatus Saccharimonadales bacterium]
MTEKTVFAMIVDGEIPCHKIYEDDKTLAFLDINPVAPGHTLVIPKTPAKFLWDLDDGDYQAVALTVKKVAQRLKQVLGTAYVGEMVVGTDVPHAHVHVVGFNSAAEIKHVIVRQESQADDEELAAMAAKLAF